MLPPQRNIPCMGFKFENVGAQLGQDDGCEIPLNKSRDGTDYEDVGGCVLLTVDEEMKKS